jgi:HSP20 family molecular chaperone IbpA
MSFYGTHATNVAKIGDKYEVSVLLPGYPKESIRVRLRGGTLHIEADAPETEDIQYIRLGYVHRSAKIRLYVGEDVKVESAKLTDGVLRVTLYDTPDEEPHIVVS